MMKEIHGGNIYKFDHKVYDFSANLNPLGMPEEVKQAVVDNIDKYESYPDPFNRELTEAIFKASDNIRVLRDPTRGGLATTLNEFVQGGSLGIELTEELIPVRPQVRAACDMLGLDALYCANEGKLVAIVAPENTETVLEAMRQTPEGREAAVIGRVTAEHPGTLTMKTAFGGRRILQKLAGAQLPRIC